MSLLYLPNELILKLSNNLSPPDMNSLLRANRRLAGLLSEPLIHAVLRDPFGKYGRPALYSAADRQDKVTVKRFMKVGLVDFVKDTLRGTWPILNDIILNQGERAAITMLECGANPELSSPILYPTAKAIHLAIMRGYRKLAQALLSNDKTDVNSEADLLGTPLDLAIRREDGALVQLLLDDPRVIVDKHGPFVGAVRRGNEEIIRLLMEDGRVDVHSLDATRRGALHAAVTTGRENVIRLLLTIEGIGINQTDCGGCTPLHRAVKEQHAGVVRALLSYDRIDVNAGGNGGWTALHIAAGFSRCEFAEILLSDPRVNVNPRKDDGETPLHVAAWLNELEVVRLLLSRDGIRLDIENNAGDSVRVFAEKGFYADGINEAILAHGLPV